MVFISVTCPWSVYGVEGGRRGGEGSCFLLEISWKETGSFFTFLGRTVHLSEGLGPAGGLLLGAGRWGQEVTVKRRKRGGRAAATSQAEFFHCQGVQVPDHHTLLLRTHRKPFPIKENQGITAATISHSSCQNHCAGPSLLQA